MKFLMMFPMIVLLASHCLAQEKAALTELDQLQVAVQKICPVMGAELGSMGEPIKVQIGEQHAYLCCASCVGKKVDATHWQTIQTNIATAQATCPIMGHPVDASMKSTVVEGRQIFVCCPPCIEKIQGDAESAITAVNASYKKFVVANSQAKSDQLQIAAQKICPVSGQELGSMGEPVKVKVGEDETAFLCCRSCVGNKIDAQHWQTVQDNLANAQGTCPVMGHAVDSTKESVVVNGRKIFVCCPPCIDKIKADPDGFVLKLNSQIAANAKGK